ncbi:MAG: DUF2752 domain-containing protein [Lachnospiraceae bacterium]|nr:DUF2752 domain-containing protein [Lachnospiraceae bacterium]
MNTDNTVKVLYKIGLFLLVPFVLVFIFLGTDKAVELLISENTVCAFRTVTGFNCPGCGGTRAAIYFGRLRFADSFKMNASVIAGAVLYLFFIVRQSISLFLNIKSLKEKHIYVMLGMFLFTVLANWIVNNIPNL